MQSLCMNLGNVLLHVITGRGLYRMATCTTAGLRVIFLKRLVMRLAAVGITQMSPLANRAYGWTRTRDTSKRSMSG